MAKIWLRHELHQYTCERTRELEKKGVTKKWEMEHGSAATAIITMQGNDVTALKNMKTALPPTKAMQSQSSNLFRNFVLIIARKGKENQWM